jgi:uncharacterized membrane protein
MRREELTIGILFIIAGMIGIFLTSFFYIMMYVGIIMIITGAYISYRGAHDNAMNYARNRFARGEITLEQFNQIKQELEKK